MNENLDGKDALLFLLGKESFRYVNILKEKINNEDIDKIIKVEGKNFYSLLKLAVIGNFIGDTSNNEFFSIIVNGFDILPSVHHFFLKEEYVKPFIVGYGLTYEEIQSIVIQHTKKCNIHIEKSYIDNINELSSEINLENNKFNGQNKDEDKLPKGWNVINGGGK